MNVGSEASNARLPEHEDVFNPHHQLYDYTVFQSLHYLTELGDADHEEDTVPAEE